MDGFQVSQAVTVWADKTKYCSPASYVPALGYTRCDITASLATRREVLAASRYLRRLDVQLGKRGNTEKKKKKKKRLNSRGTTQLWWSNGQEGNPALRHWFFWVLIRHDDGRDEGPMDR